MAVVQIGVRDDTGQIVRRSTFPHTPLSGEQLQAIVQDLGATSDEDITFVKALAKKNGVTQVD